MLKRKKRGTKTSLSLNRRTTPSPIMHRWTQTFTPSTNHHTCQTDPPQTFCESSQYNLNDFTNKSSHMRELLKSDEFMDRFASFLEENSQLDDFLTLAENLVSGNVKPDNLAWKSALHRGRYSGCTTTCNMRYDTEYSEFFALLYLIFGSSALNVLRGPSHFGTLLSGENEKGKYDPNTSKCNFVVPSVNVVQKFDTGYPKKFDPGFINKTIDQAKAHPDRQFVISFDGKRLAQGCRGERDGQVDLWGREGPPSLNQAQALLRLELDSVQIMRTDLKKTPLSVHYSRVHDVMTQITVRLKHMRKTLTSEFLLERKFEKMRDRNPDKQKTYDYTLGFIYKNTNELENSCNRSLNLNLDLCKVLSQCQGTTNLIPSSRYVLLHKQSNFHYLLPSEYVQTQMDLNSGTNSMYVSQGSQLWKDMRKEAPVTGSSMYRALGLETLKAEKEHICVHVKGLRDQVFDDISKKRIEFGSENEVNGVATLVGILIPALLPSCHEYYEVGPIFIDGSDKKKLIEVSSDGLIQCANGSENCTTCTAQNHTRIGVEVKCVYPDEEFPKFPHYQLPVRYVTQVLSEMKALDVEKLWLISFTLESVTLIEVTFDPVLWNRLLKLCEEKYGPENIRIPTRLHPDSKILRPQLKEFAETHSKLLCEVPSFRGELQIQIPSTFVSPYANAIPFQVFTPVLRRLQKMTTVSCEEASLLFNRIHDILRIPATEVLVFMLNDKDRVQLEDMPNSSPLAYAMKGKSINNADLRYLIERTQNKMCEEGISILAECYDGQWQQTVMTTINGKPLTKLRVASQTWGKVSRFGKERVINDITSSCKMYLGDLDLLQFTNYRNSEQKFKNLSLHINTNGSVSVGSLGGPIFKMPVAHLFKTNTSYNAWASHLKNMQPGQQVGEKRNKRKKLFGLQAHEKNILATLPDEIIEDLNDEDMSDDDLSEDELPDLVTVNKNKELEKLLTRENFNLLEDIIEQLIQFNPDKWEGHTPSDFYPDLLTDGPKLVQKCYKKELQIIGKVLENYTGRSFFSSGFIKAKNANLIAGAFESTNFAAEVHRTTRSPKSLSYISKQVLLDPAYPPAALHSSYAEVLHCYNKAKWRRDATVPLVKTVQTAIKSERMEMFSYPERSQERDKLEFRTLDYSHILTNMRTHICGKGYDYCPGEHYRELCNERPDILSKTAVITRSDAQNVFTAIKFFSMPVEMFMRSKGHSITADFIVLVRNWHRACDERGIGARTRIMYLLDMYNFLLDGIDFDTFPPLSKYVRGMPVTTYEAILQNICTRVQLYEHSNDNTYNVRSLSTLSNESFFSDMGRLDKEDRLYPKACNVGKLIGRVVTLNHFKHRTDK